MPRRRNLLNGADGDIENGNHNNNSGPSSMISDLFDCSSKTRRFIFLLVLLVTIFFVINNKERQALDEAHYTDARIKWNKLHDRHERYTTIQEYKRPKGPTGQFVLKPVNEFTPSIAWLMSFPNSGTSFTMTMVARASNRSFATNYGAEVTSDDMPDSLSIYPRRPEGPYWPGYGGKINSPRELPDKYIITKTHCGSRCIECGPDQYIETPYMFLRRCSMGHAFLTPGKTRRQYDVEYPPERVSKAIHLIRNPFHNIIARYHLDHRHKGVYKNNTEWLEEHTNDADGLHQWCDELDTKYAAEDKEYFQDQIPDAPCHGEFYKWAQWHNLVPQALQLIEHDVPRIVVFYEDYNTKFNETAHRILNFLELEQVGELRNFTSRSDYGGYFPPNEVTKIKTLIRNVATEETWELIKHYFDG